MRHSFAIYIEGYRCMDRSAIDRAIEDMRQHNFVTHSWDELDLTNQAVTVYVPEKMVSTI